MRFLFLLALVLLLSGCSASMPKHLEYGMQEEKGGPFTVIDERLATEKLFRVRLNSKLSYFYGDNNFDVPLITILKNRLASNDPFQENTSEITISRIILAASINEVRINRQAYGAVSDQFLYSNSGSTELVGLILAAPIIATIEKSRSRRSIWCHIDYTINGKEYSEKEVSSAKSAQLSNEIVQLYMETIDKIATRLSIKQ